MPSVYDFEVKVEELERQAGLFYNEKQYDKAVEAYLLLAEKNPKNANYLLALGYCYEALSDKQSAAAYYKEALKIDKQLPVALINLSELEYELENYAEAEFYARSALENDEQNTAAWQNLANACFCQAKYDEALEAYGKMYEKKPNSYLAAINLANTYYYLGQFEKAYEFAEKALQRHPSSSVAAALCANAANALKNYAQAAELFAQAYELDKNNFELLNALSEVYHSLGDWESCVHFAWKYLKNTATPTTEAHLNFGYLLYECYAEFNHEFAQKYAVKWVKFFPDSKIAQHMSSAITESDRLKSSDTDFIRATFDSFAPEFDNTLAALNYQAPDLIEQILQQNLKTSFFNKYHILDLGCGTGLCGEKIKRFATFKGLTGVDISEKMLEMAQQKNIYSRLICDDICHYMENNNYHYEIVVASDVLTYFGDLTKVLVRISRALKSGGVFACTISENTSNQNDFHLTPSGRFIHNLNYVEKVLKSTGLRLISKHRDVLRNEDEKPVYGYVLLAQKPDISKHPIVR